MKLFVGNLADDVVEADLHAAFAAHGAVGAVEVVRDRATGRSRGFGFVRMPAEAEARAAARALDGTDLKGRALSVNPARPRRDGALRATDW